MAVKVKTEDREKLIVQFAKKRLNRTKNFGEHYKYFVVISAFQSPEYRILNWNKVETFMKEIEEEMKEAAKAESKSEEAA